MTNKYIDLLIPIAAIALISFLLAWGLFTLMESDATVESDWYQLGGGIAGFVVLFVWLSSWFDRLDRRRADELASEIARLTAISIVKDGGADQKALNQAYNENKSYLSDNFKRQGKHWVKVLIRELRRQTIREVKLQYPTFGVWEPEEVTQDPVDDNIPSDVISQMA